MGDCDVSDRDTKKVLSKQTCEIPVNVKDKGGSFSSGEIGCESVLESENQ